MHEANQHIKDVKLMKKDEKFYMSKMSEKRVGKIGSLSLLDK